MPSEGTREPISQACFPSDGSTGSYPASSDSASRRRDLGGRGVSPRLNPSLTLCGSDLLAEAEVSAVRPHPVQHGGELADQRDLGALHAAALSDLQGPALKCGEAHH